MLFPLTFHIVSVTIGDGKRMFFSLQKNYIGECYYEITI